MDINDLSKANRIAHLNFHIRLILNTTYPDKPKYWESIGRCLAVLNDRIGLIEEGKV